MNKKKYFFILFTKEEVRRVNHDENALSGHIFCEGKHY
jgi:hypothetical protein